MAMLLFVMSMTALTSCNKEKTNLIVGKWECTTATYTEAGVTQSVPWVIGMVWEFKSDGTVISNSIDIDDEEIEVSATYVVTGDALTITGVDEDGDIDTETYLIKELTKSKLVLEERDEDELFVIEFKKI